jgi:protein required for attachment to host cells
VKTRTWIVLADAASARLYEASGPRGSWALVAELQHPESRARDSQLGTDKPGRVKQSKGYLSAMEPPTPPKKVEVKNFARQLAKALEDGLSKGTYERLILVAPSGFLGVLRSELSDRVHGRIAALVDKDYLHLDQREARDRLDEQLHAT